MSCLGKKGYQKKLDWRSCAEKQRVQSHHFQARAATPNGILQTALSLGIIIEVSRPFLYGSDPVNILTMITGAIAFIANVVCLMLIAKHREGGVHMRASWIFSTNDITNLGRIISGARHVFWQPFSGFHHWRSHICCRISR